MHIKTQLPNSGKNKHFRLQNHQNCTLYRPEYCRRQDKQLEYAKDDSRPQLCHYLQLGRPLEVLKVIYIFYNLKCTGHEEHLFTILNFFQDSNLQELRVTCQCNINFVKFRFSFCKTYFQLIADTFILMSLPGLAILVLDNVSGCGMMGQACRLLVLESVFSLMYTAASSRGLYQIVCVLRGLLHAFWKPLVLGNTEQVKVIVRRPLLLP